MSAVKVFLSYASDDRERFVLNFAERLRANGVDAWLDEWEINPGDNPVRKIFDEGLQQCQVVVLVMSEKSVQKPWVRAEVDHAFVKRVEGQAKLIPLRLDNCRMPECLLTTHWESVNNLDDYEGVFEKVLNGIYGHYPKPPLGPAPAYATPPVLPIPGLDRIDALVFERACRIAIEQKQNFINAETWLEAIEDLALSQKRIAESQEMLQEEGYVKLSRTMGPPDTIYAFSVTLKGFQEFAKAGIPEFNQLVAKVAAALAGDGGNLPTGNSLAQEFGEPLRVIEHILELLEHNDLIEITRQYGGPYMTVWRVSTKLKRAAANGL